MGGGKRGVLKYSLDWVLLERYESCKLASISNNCTISEISGAASLTNGRSHISKGFMWRFEDQQIEGEVWKKHKSGKMVSTKGRTSFNNRAALYGQHTEQSYMKTSVNSKQKMFVHRLVAETFIDNPDNLPMVDHIDGDRANNKVENLRWVSAKENASNRLPRKEYFKHCKSCTCNTHNK